MIQAGVVIGPIERTGGPKPTPGGSVPVHDLNVPYEGTEEYETPTAEMLFPPVSLCFFLSLKLSLSSFQIL
jgi:transcription initiation factor TFIIA large subunit